MNKPRLTDVLSQKMSRKGRGINLLACVQTSPISFVARVPFPRATKEIGDDCTQAMNLLTCFKSDDQEKSTKILISARVEKSISFIFCS